MTAWLDRCRRQLSLRDASPEALALGIALGLTLGVFPMYGAPTLLCLAAGRLTRTHAPLLHAVNNATSPLQLALLLPFRAVGLRLLPGTAAGALAAQAVAGWFVICAPAGLCLYWFVVWALRGTPRPDDLLQYRGDLEHRIASGAS